MRSTCIHTHYLFHAGIVDAWDRAMTGIC